MVFRGLFIPAVVLPLVGGLVIFDRLFTKPPFDTLVANQLATCTYSKTLSKPLRDLICITEPFFLSVVSDQLGKALVLLIFQLWAPISVWWYEQGGKQGRSAIFTPILFVFISEVALLAGLGPTSAVLLPGLYALFKTLGSSREGISPPASAFYTFTNFGLHQISVGLLLGLIGLPPTEFGDVWRQILYVTLVSPFFMIPLQFLTPRPPSKEDLARSTNIFDFLSTILVPAWWATVLSAGYAYHQQGYTLSPGALFLVWDCAGVLITIISLYLIDYIAGDAKGLPSLLTETIYFGPPAATARYFAAKERQGAKRAATLKKAK